MNIDSIKKQLSEAGISVTGIYNETEHTDPGLEIDNRLILQLSVYIDPPLYLDAVDTDGNIVDVGSFHSVDDVIKFIKDGSDV